MKSGHNFANNYMKSRTPPDRLPTPIAELPPTQTRCSGAKVRYITKWVSSIGHRNRVQYVCSAWSRLHTCAIQRTAVVFTFSHNRSWSENSLYVCAV